MGRLLEQFQWTLERCPLSGWLFRVCHVNFASLGLLLACGCVSLLDMCDKMNCQDRNSKLRESSYRLKSGFAGTLVQHIIANTYCKGCSYVYISHYYLAPFVYCSCMPSRRKTQFLCSELCCVNVTQTSVNNTERESIFRCSAF